jgi:hypothetical protein
LYLWQRKTDLDPLQNLIAIYDYDTLAGASALDTFRKTGAYPTNILDILNDPSVTQYEPQNQRVGFMTLEVTSPDKVDMMDTPYKATWSATFQYFEPNNMMGSINP